MVEEMWSASPYQPLLHQNFGVIGKDRTAVLDIVASLQAEICSIATKIKELDEKKRQLEHLAHSHNALLAPIRRMPDEILGRIFLAFIIQSFSSRFLYRAWVLAHVCARWRGIVLGMSQLWSYVYVNTKDSTDSTERRLQSQLRNCRQFPLTLHINGIIGTTDGYDSLLSPLFPRLTSFTYKITQQGSAVDLSKFAGAFATLNTLVLHGVETFGNAFLDCPQLRNVSIHPPWSRSCWSNAQLPWSQLVTFSASVRGSMNWQEVSYLFARISQATELKKLQLMILAEDQESIQRPGSGIPTAARFSQLEHLALIANPGVQFGYLPLFLEGFTFPNLRQLVFDGTFGVHPEMLDHLSSMLQRSACQLDQLSLGIKSDTSSLALRNLLRPLFTVQTFKVSLYKGRLEQDSEPFTLESLLRLLEYKDPAEPILPSLATIQLRTADHGLSGERFGTAVARVLKSRLLASRSIRRLSIGHVKSQTPLLNVKERTFVALCESRGLIYDRSTDDMFSELEWYMAFWM